MPLEPIVVKSTHPRGSEGAVTRQEYNKLLRKTRVFAQMLDADPGVQATNFLALLNAADGPSEVHIVDGDPNA